MLYEVSCTECSTSFSSASSLLKHFAQHAVEVISNVPGDKRKVSADIPDLYPISSLKSTLKYSMISNTTDEDSEENVDSGIEDILNPIRFCAISMDDASAKTSNCLHNNNNKFHSKCNTRKFECNYCLKTFGWSTDLKRHILTHTGERPFKCSICDSSFTRKFLLQKHQVKQHADSIEAARNKMPPLKPIKLLFKQKPRKQDKQNIKRKVCDVQVSHQRSTHFEVAGN